MKPLISVVIPVYNVEKYLKQCLDSVINQTYDNIEIICVDDCSTDSSAKILENYTKKDSRIIIKKNDKNLGLGLTRNEGIKIARGEYIHCLDSDDWLELNAYETLVYYINEYPSVEVIRFNYKIYDNKITNEKYTNTQNVNKLLNIFDNHDLPEIWSVNAWSKLIKKDFIYSNNLFYNDYRCLEDVEYAIKTLLTAKNILCIDKSLIIYRANRSNSLMSKKNKFIDNLVKDNIFTVRVAKTLPKDSEISLLIFMYEILIPNLLDAYYYGNINFCKLKDIVVNNIDESVLKNQLILKHPYLTSLLISLKDSSSISFFCKYKIKRFLKEHFTTIVKVYFFIKKRLYK